MEAHPVDVVNLQIDGMQGDGCAEKIHRVLDHLPGVALSDVSYRRRAARIMFDPAVVSEAQLRAAINRAGYRVRPPT